MKIDPYLIPLTEINLKWFGDLNVRPETMKITEESIGKKLFEMCLGMIFRNHTGTNNDIKFNKWEYIKLKIICTAEETINKGKKTTKEMGKDYL